MKPARLRTVERLAGALTALVGAAVLLGWVLDVPALKSVLPGMATMKANTALCFVLSGVAFWFASAKGATRKARAVATVSSALVLLACGLTLVEYMSGLNPGLDEALFEDATSSDASYPGRMAPNTAVAFLLLNTALLLLPGEPNRARLTGASLLGALTALLGLIAVTGYLGHVAIGYDRGELTTMALHTGAAFVLLGTACLALAWRAAGLRLAIGGGLLAGFVLGLAVFVAMGVVSYKSARQFAEATDWVRHTSEVLAKLQEVDSDIIRLQATVRGFVITGREEFLVPYEEALRKLEDDERTLRTLTADNPTQQARLATLADLIRQRKAFSAETVDLGRHDGVAAAASLISTGRGQEIMSRIESVTAAMEREERDLLVQHEAQTRALTARTFLMLPVGTFIGLGVLLAVLFLLNSEGVERHRAEAASRESSAIVESTDDAVISKTLGGIITSWNPGAERILGYSAQEAVGRPVLMLIPPERAHEEEEILSRIGRGERVEHFETVRMRKDGRRMDVSVTVSPVKDETGRIAGASKILRDVTERNAAAEAIQRLGTRLTTTLENMNAAFFTVDREWRFTYLNTECERLLHRTRSDLLGKVLWDEFKDAVGGPSDLNYHLAMSENRSVAFEEFSPALRMWLEVTAHPSSEGLAVYFHDITARKQGEAEIRESEARYRTLFDTLIEGFCTIEVIFDDDGKAVDYRFLEINPAFEKQTGLHNAQGRLMRDLAPDHEAHWFERYGNIALTGEPAHFESEARALGRHYDVFAYRVGGPESRKVAILFNDITERKRSEQTIRKSDEQFRFLNGLGEATRTLTDPEQIMAVMARMLGEHLRASRCAYADVEKDGEQFTILHDYTDGCASTVGTYQLSLFGARAVATLHSGQTLIIRSVDAELLPGEGAAMFNAIGIKAIITCPLVKDGGLRAMMAVHQTTPRDWKSDEVAMVQDVVERCWATIQRRTAEEQLHHLNVELEQRVIDRTAQLEAANKELEAFSYSVSHDLRAPLRTVDGFSQALLEDFGPQLPAEGQRQVRTIREGAQRMGALIDDLLAFSRLGRQPLSRPVGVDMDCLAREALEELLPERQGRQVEIRVAPLSPCKGDRAMLKQVWANLLSNAIKYTRKQSAAVVEIGSELEDGETVYFVRDNGTGFDMRYAHKLFGVFQRLHRAEDFEGTGVGLAIVQRIVQRHGGRVWAESAGDGGATFHFALPRGAAS